MKDQPSTVKQQRPGIRERTVTTRLNAAELRALRRARQFVKQMCGIDSAAETLRFLIRDWSAP